MEINFLGVVILCASGILYFNNVFGEQDDSVNVLSDIRKKLNNLKLSNERNERRIMRLEKQVHECQTKNADLHVSGQITAFAQFEKMLADEFEARSKELCSRLEALELSRNIEPGISGNSGKIQGREKRADVDIIRDKLQTYVGDVKDERQADVHDVVDGQKAEFDSVEHELDVSVHGTEVEIGHELTETIGRPSHIDKRIIPVTSRPSTNTIIAFSAYISDSSIDLNMGQTLPFDQVHTNEGQAFNFTTYLFTCPVSGLYYFSSSIVAQLHEKVLTKIVRDGSRLADIYSDSGSNSVVTICNKGDRIWVESDNDGSVFGNMLTTFTGFLVHASEV